MFDVVIKSIAVTDALQSETGCRLETSNKVCVRRSKSATHMVARKDPNASAANSGTVIMQFPTLGLMKPYRRTSPTR